ncbi:hypothetical protein SLEP1_g25788 [Rubroshorea leprosula]|uniref:F-box domain-containing protein n=1 Tax=Rubroshorea leprosula TaxID=152421 RepID=A0AAV5JTW0_9ROSI|nr:hypothetical protein SLEP1_g25788 [Rubroshorea leprosula]
MDAEEGRENESVNLADDPSNRAMVQMVLHLLPREILLDILSRLPITSLIHFKTTSHTGYDLIADPRLPPMFCNRVSNSNPCLILFNYNSRVSQQLYFLDGEGCGRRVRKIDPPQHLEAYKLVGSCNGLLCVYDPTIAYPTFGDSWASDALLIYNPFVGDAVRIPPGDQFFESIEVFGFGFHPRTGEFKLVRIVYYQKMIIVEDPALGVEDPDGGLDTVDESMVEVFTVGTTEWRNKGAPPPPLAFESGPPSALVEGSLHWVTLVGMGGVDPIIGIISFELADEVFEEIPHPPCQRFVSRDYSLSVLNGCLSAVGSVETEHFDIWVMKQYRVKESWVKQFSFDPYLPRGWPVNTSSSVSRVSKIICALKNGEILLQYTNSSLVSYDPVENRFKTLQISGLPNQFQALPFLPSLFSAKATMNLQS